jgi:crossover junction endodeoxyribonuclease RuvC
LLLALANAGIPIAEYSPPKIKESVSGYGNASKQQVQFMVQNMLDLEEMPKPDDAADGLAVALTHYQHYRHEMLFE